jgi:hypothetical protein
MLNDLARDLAAADRDIGFTTWLMLRPTLSFSTAGRQQESFDEFFLFMVELLRYHATPVP